MFMTKNGKNPDCLRKRWNKDFQNLTYTESVRSQGQNDPSPGYVRVCPGYQLGAPTGRQTS